MPKMNQMESYKSLKNQVVCDNRPLSKCAPKMNPILYSSVSPYLFPPAILSPRYRTRTTRASFRGGGRIGTGGKDTESKLRMRRTQIKELLEVCVGNRIEPQCQECQEPFLQRRPWQVFCSKECKAEYWRKLRRQVAEEICRRRSELHEEVK